MSGVNYTVRNLTKEDVPKALDLWRETGMQEGKQSLYTWLTVDPECFKVAVTDDGDIIGACSVVIHHEDLFFLGFYCVREKYRGMGIGTKVWDACMEHIGDRSGCLNAVPDKVTLYSGRGGFPIVESAWECVVNETKSAVQPENLSDTCPPGVEIEPFEESHLPLIYEYDRKLVGYDRELAIKLTCKEEDSRTFVAIKDGSCVGFGTIKMSCHESGQVGPLYADEKDTAEALLKKLTLSLPQAKGFAMMTISTHIPANQLVKKIGCPKVDACPRLYRKKKFDVDLGKIYAHLNLNFSPY